MTRMPTFDEIRADWERGVRTAEQAIEHPFRRHQAAPQTPAPAPVNLAAAPVAAATQQEETMSLATIEADLGQRIAAAEAAAHAAVHNEIGKLIADLPAITAEAKQLGATPVGQVAIKAAEHAAAGILPPEALTYLAGTFEASLNGLVAWYSTPQGTQQAPAGADPAPTGQQAVQAPAQ